MIKRLTIWYNRREPEHRRIMDMAERTGLSLTCLPTSDCYTVWTRLKKDDSIGQAYYGPTSIKRLLNALLEKRVI